MKKSWMLLALAGLALFYFLKPKTRAGASPSNPLPPTIPPVDIGDIPKNLPLPLPDPRLPPNVLSLAGYYTMLDTIRAVGGFGGTAAIGPQFVAHVRASEVYWKLTPAQPITTGVNNQGMIVSTG